MAKKSRKQSYYKKEYSRLLAQAKKTYNEMSLGGIFGEDLPSFEKILNYAGTSSGLKKPTKESLKALRKLKTESDILWGIEHTLSKKSPRYKENLEKLESLKEVKEKAERSIQKAKKDFKKYNREYTKKEKEQKQFDTFSPIEALLSQLRYYLNYCTERQYQYTGKKGKYANEQVQHYEYARNSIEKLISEIEDILNSGDTEKLSKLSQGCTKFFNNNPGGVEVEMFYNPNDGDEVRHSVLSDLDTVTDEAKDIDTSEKPSSDEYADFIFEEFF